MSFTGYHLISISIMKASLITLVGGHSKDICRVYGSPVLDRLEFVKLSFFREAGGGDFDEISNVVLGRGTVAFVTLLRHCNTALDELHFDRIPERIGYHIWSEEGSRDNNCLSELGRESNTKCMRRGIPRSINRSINSHLHRRDCRQLVKSLL